MSEPFAQMRDNGFLARASRRQCRVTALGADDHVPSSGWKDAGEPQACSGTERDGGRLRNTFAASDLNEIACAEPRQ
jgi:hypothetical protein